METPRKYRFMIFLAAVSVACILMWIVPSWEKEMTGLVTAAFVGLLAWALFSQLDRIESKLDAMRSEQMNGRTEREKELDRILREHSDARR